MLELLGLTQKEIREIAPSNKEVVFIYIGKDEEHQQTAEYRAIKICFSSLTIECTMANPKQLNKSITPSG